MINGKAAVFEAEVVVFPVEAEREVLVLEKEKESIRAENLRAAIDLRERFARLKKKCRKRSAGIL